MFLWLIWSLWFISFNQKTRQTRQTQKRDKPDRLNEQDSSDEFVNQASEGGEASVRVVLRCEAEGSKKPEAYSLE